MAFAETDLNVAQSEIDEIKTALANSGQANAFTNAMPESEQKVRDWTARYTVPDVTLKRLWQAVLLWQLYTLVGGQIPDNRQKAYDDAMSELKDIRDGKFPQYPLAATQPAGFAQTGAAWGSEPKLCL